MPSSGVQTTGPSSSDTFEPGNEAELPSFFPVCVWSATEPHRIAESALLLPFVWIYWGATPTETSFARKSAEPMTTLARRSPASVPGRLASVV
jgi:hypothetical protein